MTSASPEMITSARSVIVQAADRQAVLSLMYIEANSRKSKKICQKLHFGNSVSWAMNYKPKKPEIWWIVSLTFKKALTWHHLCPEAQLLVKIIIKIMYKCEKCISDV